MSDVMWEGYEPLEWWIDRWWNMEFLQDQTCCGTWQPALCNEQWRNQYKPGYLPYVI